MDNFPGLIKISMTTEKIEVARLQELNSNSFEYNSNGFELGLGLVWPKMFGVLVELGKRTGWHQKENGRGRKQVKLSCFFDKRVKPKNLEKLNNLKGIIPRR